MTTLRKWKDKPQIESICKSHAPWLDKELLQLNFKKSIKDEQTIWKDSSPNINSH